VGTPTELFVDGLWRSAEHGEVFAVDDPATGDTLAEVADGTPADGLAALDAAVLAQPAWADTAPRERSELLRRTFEAVIARTDDLAELITLEMGKPLAEARAEVAYGAEFLRWYAEEAVRIDGRFSVAPNGDGRILTVRQPVGPCLFVTPWNFPLAMGTRKIGPALAAGCTSVVKPAAETPLTMLRFAAILAECGLPPGVVNVLTTTRPGPVTEPLIRDGRVRKLSFTGSTAVGRVLAEQAADQLLRVSMELGGNAPFIVFPDADLDAAVDGAVLAKMRNMGQSCVAANRFLVHHAVADDFAGALAHRLGRLRVGPGRDEGVDVGPLIDAPARSGIDDLVSDATGRGADVLTGGSVPDGPGWFYPPTVLHNVAPGSALWRQEIFGPVAPVTGFADEQEAVELANDTAYGLVAYLYTSEVSRAVRVAERLAVGMVGLNRGLVSNAAAPFGGVKHSGLGREGGPEGLHEYLSTKYVALDLR
jgi:succinate-semialdehyde dehydrogenase/glutarate-semialdehyde dehydrogenase